MIATVEVAIFYPHLCVCHQCLLHGRVAFFLFKGVFGVCIFLYVKCIQF